MVLDVTSAIGYDIGQSFRIKLKKQGGTETEIVVTSTSGPGR